MDKISCLSSTELQGCMHVDYSKVPDDIKEYLDKHYARDNDSEWVDGQLADAAVDISKKMHDGEDADLTEMHGRIMRQCWETGWNNVYDSGVNLYEMINMYGFLSQKERWHSARSRMDGIVIYRGCSHAEVDRYLDKDISTGDELLDEEYDALGYSWTLNKAIAIEFARQRCGKVLIARLDTLDVSPRICMKYGIRARRDNAVWLDTPESEVLWVDATVDGVIGVENVDYKENAHHVIHNSIRPTQVKVDVFDLAQARIKAEKEKAA